MNTYKVCIRHDITYYHDVVLNANNETDARLIAVNKVQWDYMSAEERDRPGEISVEDVIVLKRGEDS